MLILTSRFDITHARVVNLAFTKTLLRKREEPHECLFYFFDRSLENSIERPFFLPTPRISVYEITDNEAITSATSAAMRPTRLGPRVQS